MQGVAKEMYKNSSKKPYFKDLIQLMVSGECELYVLSREDAIDGWRELIGPVDPAKAKTENPNSY
jgi:nucleoside-diphosphate kinase